MLSYLLVLIIVFIAVGLVVFLLLSSRDRTVLFRRLNNFSYKGEGRKFRLYIPKDASKIRRLIFVFHGYGSNAWQMAYVTGFHNSVDSDTMVVYPQATKPTKSGQKSGWNAGFCCGSGYVNNVDDVGFIKELVNYLTEKYSLECAPVFAAGFSNGAMFVNRLASECPGQFAGFATAAGSIGTRKNSLDPTTPVPILLMHGENDRIVPYEGGPGSTDSSFTWLSFGETKVTWERANRAHSPQTTIKKGRRITTYGSHADPLKIITYRSMGHKWPDWRLGHIWHHQTEGTVQSIKFFTKKQT